MVLDPFRTISLNLDFSEIGLSPCFCCHLNGYAAMVLDKANARNGIRRIPEATLLNLAILGGSIGTVIAQQTVRHKTRKEPFRSKLIGILVLQIVVLIALTVALIIAGSPEALWQRLTS